MNEEDTAKRLCTSSPTRDNSSSDTKIDEKSQIEETSEIEDSEKSADISQPFEEISGARLKRKRSSEQAQENANELFVEQSVKRPNISPEPLADTISIPEKRDRN